jgi:hypothetical protein
VTGNLEIFLELNKVLMTHLLAKLPLFITLSCIDLIDPIMNEPTVVVRQQLMFAG